MLSAVLGASAAQLLSSIAKEVSGMYRRAKCPYIHAGRGCRLGRQGNSWQAMWVPCWWRLRSPSWASSGARRVTWQLQQQHTSC